MPGIIILDGPDATGKTTLQKFLVNRYSAKHLHLTYNSSVASRMFDYQTEAMIEAIKLSQDHLVVVDRHWISEAIYARVFRGGSPWPHMGRLMDRVWRKHAAMYVICLPDTIESGIENHHKNLDPSHPYDDVKFTELLTRYLALYEGDGETTGDDYAAQLARHNPMCDRPDVIDYRIGADGSDMKGFCDKLIYQLGLWRKLQWPKALDSGYMNFTGHWAHADYLVVGERFNLKNSTLVGSEWPFYEYLNSSKFLLEIFAKINVDESRLMFTNSVDLHNYNNHDIREFYDRNFKIISLGNTATTWCRTLGVKRFNQLHHPQYVKRFLSQQGSAMYEDDWKEALNGN